VGAALSSLLGKPLVLDYRDPWTASYLELPSTWLRRLVNPRLERWVLGRAAAVVAAHRTIFRFLDRFPNQASRRLWVPNGYDPDDFSDAEVPASKQFTLTYMGSFFSRRRSPLALLETLEELLQAGVLDPSRFRLRVGGYVDLVRQLCKPGGYVAQVLRVEGYLTHRKSVRCLQESTVNWILCDRGEVNHYTPGKFYEVLHAGRPVLLLCPEGPTTRLARHAGGCWIVDPEDRPGIRRTLTEIYGAWMAGTLPRGPNSSRFFDRSHQGKRLLRFLRSVVDAQNRRER